MKKIEFHGMMTAAQAQRVGVSQLEQSALNSTISANGKTYKVDRYIEAGVTYDISFNDEALTATATPRLNRARRRKVEYGNRGKR